VIKHIVLLLPDEPIGQLEFFVFTMYEQNRSATPNRVKGAYGTLDSAKALCYSERKSLLSTLIIDGHMSPCQLKLDAHREVERPLTIAAASFNDCMYSGAQRNHNPVFVIAIYDEVKYHSICAPASRNATAFEYSDKCIHFCFSFYLLSVFRHLLNKREGLEIARLP
jgi:hypothetical protein